MVFLGVKWVQRNAESMERWVAFALQEFKKAGKTLLKTCWDHMYDFVQTLTIQLGTELLVKLTSAQAVKTVECVFVLAKQLKVLAST